MPRPNEDECKARRIKFAGMLERKEKAEPDRWWVECANCAKVEEGQFMTESRGEWWCSWCCGWGE